MKKFLQFWVTRKDELFSEYTWPLDINVYEDDNGEIRVQAIAAISKDKLLSVPKEWQSQIIEHCL